MNHSFVDVGAKIRACRKRKQLSLIDLSRITGIAASNLSSIELNKSSPTLNTLMKIASAFGMKAGAFLDEVLYQKAVHCPAGEGENIPTSSPAVSVRPVTAGIFLSRMEASIITIEMAADSYDLEAAGTDRFVYCLEGRVSARVDDETFSLSKGDSLYMLPGTSVSFKLRGAGNRKSSFLLVSAATPS
ncbi:MAG: helix-turn-helix transcriptional regulator [Desulfomonile tiedjei]|nr:helix-turn-helix transcriptional regulator [Desulfomonile tiedjei]